MLHYLKSLFKNEAYEDLKGALFLQRFQDTTGAVLLDVRTAAEVSAGSIPGAQNIDFRSPDFEGAIGEMDKGKTYFVYCRSGVRSANACRKMHKMGFRKLFNLAGGYISLQ